jgi:hypothetical protein
MTRTIPVIAIAKECELNRCFNDENNEPVAMPLS